ncbi:MAG: hypothetical protein HOC63_05415 [Rhodospirillales bacterium]|nr:hypothetical protein [Rhodospirillales bacterium]MBT4626112.1 hypothetical protein [Rhodospirillales bacterium]MBT5522252.1 hypothetical protein [Rhodospirillales bacterium]MBT6109371.1 hypothetical protein [Rhodospirillales bacterium]
MANLARNLFELSSAPVAQLYSDRGTAEILILGNSRAYHHFFDQEWSRETGRDVKSYALPGASMELMEAFLKDYIDRYGPPLAVIVEPSNLIVGNEQIPNLKMLSTFSTRIDALLWRDFGRDSVAGRLMNLYRYNSTGYLNVLHKIVTKYQQPHLYGQITEDKLRRVEENTGAPRFLSEPRNIESLHRIAVLADQHGINLTLATTPVLAAYLTSPNEMPRWLDEIRNVLLPGQPMHDFSGAIIDVSLFYDAAHLNEAGTRRLFDIMLEDSFFQHLTSDSPT